MVSANKKSSLCMGFGSVFVVMGAISVVFWPALFFAQLKNNMILTNVSESFGIWKETPIPMYLECFMWNITNMREILAGTAAKVEVNQMGPYVYRESHSKTNITFKDNGTVSFFNQRFWHYEPEMSNGSLSDRITSINPIVVSIAYMMRNERLILRPGVDAFLRIFHRNMFVTANVSSWLFDGIDDPVLDIAQNITEIDIPYDKFGWFYDRNGSETFDGQFLMDTGANDFSQLGNIVKWRNSNRTLYRDQCGEVKGSTGELWAPELGQPEVTIFAPDICTQLGNIVKWRNSNRTLYRDQCGEVKGSTGELWAPELGQPEVTIFAPDICTYMTLHKQGPYSTEGIDGVMYAANDSVFDNGYKYGSMACYCDEVRDNECLRPGALNVSSCRLGAPAFVSMPHFYNADPYYPSKIQGLDPVPDHAFRMALELFTGVPLFVKAQLQINLLVRHITGISINNQLPDRDTLVPMFWFRQEVAITPEYASLARWALNIRFGLPYVFYSITVIGLLLLISGIVVLIRKLLRSPDEQPILQTQSQEDLSR